MNKHKPVNSHLNQDSNNEDYIDYDLVDFLKSNHPIAPPAHPNLQAQIMMAVSTMPINSSNSSVVNQKFNWQNICKIGLAASAIAASLGVIIFNQPYQNGQTIQTALKQNSAETLKNEDKSLEKSLVNNWHLPDEEFTTSYSMLSSASYE